VIPEGKPGALVGSTLGGLQLTAVLGTGGMAEVYRGRDPRTGREYAVKVLPEHLAKDPGYVTRFRNEAQRVAALNHPNIVSVIRFGEESGLLYIIMPVLKESLRDKMDRERIIKPVEAGKLTAQIASALDVAHKHGLVHRDVKPENILLNAEGRALLTDFGIAREVDALREPNAARTLAATGLPVGTPEYMAPEQLRGGVADQRVDVYGLGAVLYEMLTGHVPHDADTPYEVAARVLTERVLPPSEHNPAIWPELEEVVLGALTQDADDRYPDMRSFASALRRSVLSRTGGAAVAADMLVGTVGPTPLARSLSTRRLGEGETLSGIAVAGKSKGKGRVKLSGRTLIIAVGVVSALAIATGTTLGFLRFFDHPGGGVGIVPTATSDTGSTPGTTPSVGATVTVTAGATATPRPQPTATPVPSLSVNPTNLHVCSGSPQTFTVKYTGGPSTATLVVTSSSFRFTVSINGGQYGMQESTTLQRGVSAVVSVQTSSSNRNARIYVSVTGFPQQTVNANSNGC
jgi:tRNA A-37 threonylcarbamoyl transferase component Bud32